MFDNQTLSCHSHLALAEGALASSSTRGGAGERVTDESWLWGIFALFCQPALLLTRGLTPFAFRTFSVPAHPDTCYHRRTFSTHADPAHAPPYVVLVILCQGRIPSLPCSYWVDLHSGPAQPRPRQRSGHTKQPQRNSPTVSGHLVHDAASCSNIKGSCGCCTLGWQ